MVVFATLGEGFDSLGNESKVAAPTGGSGNVGDNGGEDNNGGGESPTASTVVVYLAKVSDLYAKQKLTKEDIEKIKKNLTKIKGVKSVDCLPPHEEVKISYDSSKIKESEVILNSKRIELRKSNPETINAKKTDDAKKVVSEGSKESGKEKKFKKKK